MSFVVAIDGPAGSGKGTVTKIVAERMGLVNIDTGAMYRCVTLMCLENNIDYTQIDEINKILDVIKIEIKNEDCNQTFYLNGKNVTKEIRYDNVNKNVAKFAAIKEVRDKVTPMQREMGEKQDIIMEGRDITTVVFPNADVKIYLDASPEERAERRYRQNKENGIDTPYEEILQNVIDRDYRDSHREIAPLTKAPDAIYVDSTGMTVEEEAEEVIKIIKEKKG